MIYKNNMDKFIFSGLGKSSRERIDTLKKNSILLPQEGDSVLDIGCGIGRFLEVLKERYKNINVDGIDLEPQEEIEGVTITKGDIADMPYESESFDRIYSKMVFDVRVYPHQTLSVRRQMLHEVHRVLKSGGIYLALEPFATRNFRREVISSGSFSQIDTSMFEEVYDAWEKI